MWDFWSRNHLPPVMMVLTLKVHLAAVKFHVTFCGGRGCNAEMGGCLMKTGPSQTPETVATVLNKPPKCQKKWETQWKGKGWGTL